MKEELAALRGKAVTKGEEVESPTTFTLALSKL